MSEPVLNVWRTTGEAKLGIEHFLLDGPRPMLAICNHAMQHGVGPEAATSYIYAMRNSGRLQEVSGQGRPFALTGWNASFLQRAKS